MAKKKIKEVDLEITESAEEKIEESLEVDVESIEEQVESVEEIAEEIIEPIADVPVVPVIEETPTFKDNDIVLFENKQGELRYAPYKYITKRGYKAIELYKNKK